MKTTLIDVDMEEAARLHRAYLDHRHFETDTDREIRRTYAELARGQTIIKAIESVAAAGVGEDRLPKLALVRADMPRCYLRVEPASGGALVRMSHTREGASGNHGGRKRFAWPRDAFGDGLHPGIPWRHNPSSFSQIDAEAVTPMVPLHLRPRTSLSQYHILFEAEWRNVVPKDPFLLRRMGKGDLWLVVAVWDLTEVERAALQSRVFPN